MDLDRLNAYREWDIVTDTPGLSDSFYAAMLERIKSGRDITTDPDLFNTLYLKPNLTRADVDAYAGQISVHDQRILMSRILAERREDERDARRLEAERKARLKAEASEAEKERVAEEKAAREKRNAWAAVARTLTRKAMNEMGMKAEEGMEVLSTLQSYIDDKDVP